MKRRLLLFLVVPILVLTITSCDADMRSTLAGTLGNFGGNVYIQAGLVEGDTANVEATTSAVSSFGVAGTAAVGVGDDFSDFGVDIKIPAGVTKVMKPQSKQDRETFADDLTETLTDNEQLAKFKNDMGKPLADPDGERKKAVQGTVDTFNELVKELDKGGASPITEIFSAIGFEIEEGAELTEGDVLLVQMMVDMVATTIETLQDIAGEGKDIQDLGDGDFDGHQEKLLDVVDEILLVAKVSEELSGASNLDLFKGIDLKALMSGDAFKGMSRSSRDGDSDEGFGIEFIAHLGPELVNLFRITKSGNTYTWTGKNYKRYLREQKAYVNLVDQALSVIRKAKFDDDKVVQEKTDFFDESTAFVYLAGALLNEFDVLGGDSTRKYIQALMTENPKFANGTFTDSDEFVEPEVDGKTLEQWLEDDIDFDTNPGNKESVKKIIENTLEILKIGGFKFITDEIGDADDLFDDWFKN